MIHIPERKKLSKDTILALIGEGDILQYYFGPVKPGKTIISPFRKEQTESLYISLKDGHYFYLDLGDSTYKGDCFRAVMQLFNLKFGEALDKINQDFGLGLAEGSLRDYRRIVQQIPKHKEKPPTVIIPHIRPFSEKELTWWKKHLQTEAMLIEENIFAISGADINGKEIHSRGDELAFLYDYPEIGKKKLYYPERSGKDGKWAGSIPTSYVENISAIKDSQKVIIYGSKKDRMVGQTFFRASCNTQNESNSSFTPEFLELLNGKQVWLFWDSDDTGWKQANSIAQQYGFKTLFIPEEWGHKDLASLVYNEGVYQATEFFYKNKLI